VSLLGVAVLGVSASAPLIAATAAPALAIALWRNVLGAGVVLAAAALSEGRSAFALSGVERRAVLLAGIFLAMHFATWVPSVTLTTVASSTALVATQPVWNALIARRRGELVTARTWMGIALALAGVLVLTGVDITVSTAALRGDLLALAGGFTAALYVEQGATARRTMSTAAYSGLVYAVCSMLLLGLCLLAGVRLGGLGADAWGKIVLLTVLAQLVGHTLVNRSLRTVAPVVVSLAILLEPPGAAVIAAVWLGQVPPLAAVPAALLVLAGVALVVAGRRGRPEPVDVD
jgi:drug/metabolite transporter (DMT)-like permease